MKKKNLIILISIIFIVCICISIFVINVPKNKYVCLNKDVKLGDIITKEDIKECTTKNEIPKDVITENDFFNFEEDKEYIYIGVSKNSKDFLEYEDFSVEQNKINLTNKLTIEGVMCPNNDINPEEIKYEIYINNKKLYTKNLVTGVSNLIFDDEEVLYITKRSYCCDASADLLILTEKGNLYMSKEDMHYRDNCYEHDFSFTNYNLKDIVSFKEYYILGSMNVGKMYAIDKNGNSYLIDEEI